ncbi:MAG: glycosyltransferase [Cyanobacteria bacterium P01_G01_bin.67]
MNILLVHNQYQQLGGEDSIVATEAKLLESYGHQVYRYQVNNHQLKEMNPWTITKATLWNSQIHQEIRTLIKKFKPQIAHFHNTFPLISPAAYYAAQAEGVPVVQTIHNFRLLCANALFFRNGRVCEECLIQKNPLPGIIHSCYRNSRTASTAAALTVKLHSLIGTWSKAIDTFVVYSHFAHKKLVQGGLPIEKIAFKTNFLYPVPKIGNGSGNYALFVGRLAPEKGTSVMLEAWEHLGHKIPLKIVGDGPLADEVATVAKNSPGVEWLGRKSLADVYELMKKASFLIIPSEWYETFGRVGIEALATGTPLLVSKIGALAELVKPGLNGLLFNPGDATDLAEKAKWLVDNPRRLSQMRQEARQSFEAKYLAADNYHRLMEIYNALIYKSPRVAVNQS